MRLRSDFVLTAGVVALSIVAAGVFIVAMSKERDDRRAFKVKCTEKDGIVYSVSGGKLCMKKDSVIIIP